MSGFTVVDSTPILLPFVGSSGPTSPTSGIHYGTPIVLTVPDGVEEGDIIFAHFGGNYFEIGGTAWITEEGWYPLTNKIGQDDTDVTHAALSQYLFYKIATASEPATYRFTPSTNNDIVTEMSGALSVWRGVDRVSPIVAFYSVSNGLVSAYPFPTLEVSTPALTVPVTDGQAILFGLTFPMVATGSAGEITYAQVNSPAGSTIRYSSLGEQDNGASPPSTQVIVQVSLECADLPVTGGETDVFTWSTTYANNSGSSNVVTNYVYGTVVVLRASADADPVTWAVQGDPVMPNADVSLYTERQEGIVLSPNNSDNLYTIYGANVLSPRMVIARYSRSLGTQQATAVIEGSYPVVTSFDNLPFAISNDDSGLFWSSEFEDTSPDNNSGRVYRYNTQTLTFETASDWLPDDDAIIAQQCGTVGTWSENLLFGASGFFGSVGHGLYVFDPLTLELLTEVPFTDFYPLENGFFTDMTVDCDGNAWVQGTGSKVFKVSEGYVVTAYDISATLPTASGVIGLHPRLDALMFGLADGVAIWDIQTQTVLATYTMPAYATSLLQLKSSFMSQSVGVTHAGLWVSFFRRDRVPFSGDSFYSVPYAYIQKLNEDTLVVEATYVVPMGDGVQEYTSLALDTGVMPYRLWGWGIYSQSQFGPTYGLTFPSWFTTPQVPADEWAPGTNPTNTQLIHGRGFNYRMPVTADVPTVAGSGSRVCAQIPVVVPVITCYDLDNIDGHSIVELHGTGFTLAIRVIVSPYNNPYGNDVYEAPILQITSDTELVVSVPNPGIGQGYWFVFLSNGQMSNGTNQACHPFTTSPWKTRKVWFESLEP